MRAGLLLVLRTGTAIAVATASVQLWGLAVRGETPALGTSIVLPPTPAAVAAVVPRHPPRRLKHASRLRGIPWPSSGSHAAPGAAGTPTFVEPSAPMLTPTGTKAKLSPQPSRAKPKQTGSKPTGPSQEPLTAPPASPEIVPVPPPAPEPEPDHEPPSHSRVDPLPPHVDPPPSRADGNALSGGLGNHDG